MVTIQVVSEMVVLVVEIQVTLVLQLVNKQVLMALLVVEEVKLLVVQMVLETVEKDKTVDHFMVETHISVVV